MCRKLFLASNFPKGRGHIVGFNEIANHIDTDISQIFFVVGAPAQLAIFFLLFLGLQQPFFQKRNQWISPQTGFVLCLVLLNRDPLSLYIAGCYRMPNGEAVMVEVKGTPFQTDNLTAAQAVKSSQ